MKQKKVAFTTLLLLLILLFTGAAGLSTFAPDAYGAPAGWQQVNSNGFGDPDAEEVSAVAAFAGSLYAGTSNPTDGARIFRAADGLTWTAVTEPGFGSAHDTAAPAILDLTVFNSRLYASTGRGNAAQIWRTVNGTNWARVVNAGFGDPDIVAISVLAEYNGMIYAGATHAVTGAQIWRSYTGDSNSWTPVAPAVPGTEPATVTGLAVFDGAIYAAVASEAPAQIWRSYGGAWTAVVGDGFGDSQTTATGGMAVYDNDLYVGAGSTGSGAQLWRSNDGENWEQAIPPGFGDPNNQQVETVYVFQNELYVSVKNTVTGIEIWRLTGGTLWEQVNQDGFGDGHNTGSNWGNATAGYSSQLYVGTANSVDGGELWQLTTAAVPVYGVTLSPDDSLAGLSGETLTYTLTITNSGNVSDTFALALAGNVWTTVLSSPGIVLAPAATGALTVTVTIPESCVADVVDAVTISATSGGDAAVQDSTTLTTSCIGGALSQRLYLPLLLRSP